MFEPCTPQRHSSHNQVLNHLNHKACIAKVNKNIIRLSVQYKFVLIDEYVRNIRNIYIYFRLNYIYNLLSYM